MIEMTDEESSSNEAQANVPSKNIRKSKTPLPTRQQAYTKKWEEVGELKSWISSSKQGKLFYHCKVCNKDFKTTGGKKDAIKHAQTLLHLESLLLNTSQPSVSKIFQQTTTLSTQAKEAEIKVAAFAVQHNLPFSVIGPMVNLMKNIFPDSQIVKNITCDRTKCTSIVKNVTGQFGFEKLVSNLKTKKFSLLVDESTDVSSVKHLALVVRFIDEEIEVKDQFLALLPCHDATAEGLYAAVSCFFDKHQIPWKRNMIGYASDGAANVSGCNKSLGVLLQRNSDLKIFRQKCICHSWDKCASEACQALYNTAENLVRNVHHYFAHSYKRKHRLELVQKMVDVEEHKSIMYAATRWLSLHLVVMRYIEQLDALKIFFKAESTIGDDPPAATTILHQLNNPEVMNSQNSSIVSLAKCFPNLAPPDLMNKLDREWRQLMNHTFLPDTPTECLEFWRMISNMKLGDGTKRYPSLSSFIFDLLVLPHSTATVERLFSFLNLCKTDTRNRMENETLTGIIHTKCLLNGKPVSELKIPKTLFLKHNSSMYTKKQEQAKETVPVDYAIAMFS